MPPNRRVVLDAAPRRPFARLMEGEKWFRITNATGENDAPAVIDIYDEIGWMGVRASDFVAQLRDITASSIELHVNSPGGDVWDGIAIYNALIDHPASVVAVVDALAASAASFIVQAGDRVVMGRNSEIMIHDALGMTIGNEATHREMADRLASASDNLASIYADRAGNGGAATWRKAMRAETWYSAEEAVAAGLADEVLKTSKRRAPSEPAGSGASARWDLSVFKHAGRADAPAPDLGGRPARPAAVATADEAERCPFCTAELSDAAVEAHECQACKASLEDVTCPECGANVPPGANTCPECGHDMTTEDTTTVAASLDEFLSALDAADFDPKALHRALLDAADVAELGVNTMPLREALEEFPYDPDALRGTLFDLFAHPDPPAPEPAPEPAIRTVDIDQVADSLRKAMLS